MTRNRDLEQLAAINAGEDDYAGTTEPSAPVEVKWVSEQNIDNGHSMELLVQGDGEVIGSLEQLGVDLWRTAASKRVKRFYGKANAQAFVLRMLADSGVTVQVQE